jgi:hypothetical protein
LIHKNDIKETQKLEKKYSRNIFHFYDPKNEENKNQGQNQHTEKDHPNVYEQKSTNSSALADVQVLYIQNFVDFLPLPQVIKN